LKDKESSEVTRLEYALQLKNVEISVLKTGSESIRKRAEEVEQSKKKFEEKYLKAVQAMKGFKEELKTGADKLRDQLKNRSDLQALEDAKSRLEKDRDDWKALATERKNEVDALESRLAIEQIQANALGSFQNVLQVIDRDIKGVQHDLNGLNNAVATTQGGIGDLANTVSTGFKGVERVNKELSEFRVAVTEGFGDCSDDVDCLGGHLVNLVNPQGEVEGKLDTISADVKLVADLGEKVADLKTKVEEQDKSIQDKIEALPEQVKVAAAATRTTTEPASPTTSPLPGRTGLGLPSDELSEEDRRLRDELFRWHSVPAADDGPIVQTSGNSSASQNPAQSTSGPSGSGVDNSDWRPLVSGTLVQKKALAAGVAPSVPRYEDPSHSPQALQVKVRELINAGRSAYESKGTSVDYFVSLSKGTACVSNKIDTQGAKRPKEEDIETACSRCVAKRRPCLMGITGQNKLVLMPMPTDLRINLQETDFGFYVASD